MSKLPLRAAAPEPVPRTEQVSRLFKAKQRAASNAEEVSAPLPQAEQPVEQTISEPEPTPIEMPKPVEQPEGTLAARLRQRRKK